MSSKQQQQIASTTTAVEPSPPPAIIKVNRDDAAALKRGLDDLVLGYFLETKGFQPDYSISNQKLLVATIAVSMALLAQFWPEPFPKNWWILFVCCGTYAILANIVFQYILWFKEKDIILQTTTGEPTPLNVKSSMPKVQYNYTLCIQSRQDQNISEQLVRPVGSFYDETGRLDDVKFKKAVQDLYSTFQNAEKKKKK
ncbi:signal peptidase [Planoprotostelium fungivorum]|uniref:Signal peptidase complex subunit 2 n=1 Tax=Planoprotostelium fungivorum TaxID=1890364 RepID=A0A2P6P0B5_9EUKA|nr:signal peptidase [Planoprotostelium fungivorum]